MHNPQRNSFVIEVAPFEQQPFYQHNHNNNTNFSSMKLFNRFRKILVGLIFSLPPRCGSGGRSGSKQRGSDRFEPPKTSCSSYYSSHNHYNEAISDCIDFFNKSSHDPQNPDFMV